MSIESTVSLDCSQRSAIARAYRLAEECQDACNLSGVAGSFAALMRDIWSEAGAFGRGTDYVNRHPVVTLFLSKLMSLNGEIGDCDHYGRAARAIRAVRAIGEDLIGSPDHRAIMDAYFAG